MNRDKFRKYGKRAGLVILAVVALDLAAGAAAVVMSTHWLRQ